MNKNLYSLVFAASLLFFVSCADEKSSPISGSTEDPNMSHSIVCSRVTANKADMQQAGCYWTAEMWNRNSGYRVRTGLDNGTNTSGIWTWSVLREFDHVEWPGNATASYDSMALADVIDKCGGSLCGTAIFENDGSNERPVDQGAVSLEFAFAGKNSSGKFDAVDVRQMHGLCIEYFGENLKMELVVDENAAFTPRAVGLPGFAKTENQTVQKGYELCLSWNAFAYAAAKVDDVVSHVQGLRITVNEEGHRGGESYFEIISLGGYTYSAAPTNTFHPVKSNCSVASVKTYFCDCSYSEERSRYEGAIKAKRYITEKISQINGKSVVPVAVEKCLNDLDSYGHDEYEYEKRLHLTNETLMWERPCDNPLPQIFACTDGSESVSQEYSEKYAEYVSLLNANFESEKTIADSLYAQCLTLHDSLSDGRNVPDSCRIGLDVEKSVSSLEYAYDAILESFNAYYDSLTALSNDSSLDDSIKTCANAFITYGNMAKDSLRPFVSLSGMMPPIMLPQNKQFIIKTMTCGSGNTYYTDEYKEYLQELGIQDETDSIQVYNAVKRAYPHEVQKAFESCYEFLKSN
jgi:hypothetical protein